MARGTTLRLQVLGQGATRSITLVTGARTVLDAPASPEPLMFVRSVINWRGHFVPCSGTGPLAPVAIEVSECDFAKYGYIRVAAAADSNFKRPMRSKAAHHLVTRNRPYVEPKLGGRVVSVANRGASRLLLRARGR